MDHVEARELLSARLDGELDAARDAALDEHLAGCADCRGFGARAQRLAVLVHELPREEAPAIRWLPAPERPARRWSYRTLPALAAAVAVAVLIAILGPPGRFTMPIPAAASTLTTIRTLYVERQFTDNKVSGRERIWFRAPADVRIERTTAGGTSLTIERPGARYVRSGSLGFLQTGLPPSADVLPEPLSPTVALLGDPKGAGPTIDGRPTTRYDLTFDDQNRRIAYVDATTYAVLGTEQSLILQKLSQANGAPTVRSRVVDLRVNQPLDPSLFALPAAAPNDQGFRRRSLDALPVHPASIPSGFSLVTSGSSPDADVLLFARRSFLVEVDVTAREEIVPTQTMRTETVSIRNVSAKILYDLYSLPRIVFPVQDRFVTIVGPLDRAALMTVARQMFAL